jgi:DNA polymerase type B, organellar and viral
MHPTRVGDVVKAGAYKRKVGRPRARKAWEGSILGFDTEYDSKTREFLSFQLAGDGWSELRTEALTLDALRARMAAHNVQPPFRFVTYFSLAELQWLPVWSEGIEFFEGTRGSLDVLFRGSDIQVVDLWRWYDGQSLSAAARSVGLEKLEWARDRVSRADLKDARFVEYAIHDAVLCREIALRLAAEFDPWGIDIWQARTPAGAASSYFRSHYLRERLGPPKPRVRYFALRGGWGGRAEVFVRGEVPDVREVDIRSAYPNACVSLGSMPLARDWVVAKTWREAATMVGGFGHAYFKFPTRERYPSLPMFSDGCLIYPRAGEAWATFAEFAFAIEQGADVRWIEGYGWRSGTSAARDCMLDLLEKRKAATGARKVALKLVANSLVGKWAQAVETLSINDLRRKADELECTLEALARVDPFDLELLGVRKRTEFGSCFLPEWNGLVTGYVRAQLSRMLVQSEAVYCATDAVWTPREGFSAPGCDEKRRGPATVLRTRLAAIWEPGKPHLAHHAIASRDFAEQSLDAWRRGLWGIHDVAYRVRRPLKPRESLKGAGRLGEWREFARTGGFGWDEKRRLLVGGDTEPWPDTQAHQKARASLKRS